MWESGPAFGAVLVVSALCPPQKASPGPAWDVQTVDLHVLKLTPGDSLNVQFAEHRYYGESKPFDPSVIRQHMQYLTATQVSSTQLCLKRMSVLQAVFDLSNAPGNTRMQCTQTSKDSRTKIRCKRCCRRWQTMRC